MNCKNLRSVEEYHGEGMTEHCESVQRLLDIFSRSRSVYHNGSCPLVKEDLSKDLYTGFPEGSTQRTRSGLACLSSTSVSTRSLVSGLLACRFVPWLFPEEQESHQVLFFPCPGPTLPSVDESLVSSRGAFSLTAETSHCLSYRDGRHIWEKPQSVGLGS